MIADDHPFFTEGVVNALKPHSDIQVVATLHHGEMVVKEVAEVLPDVILLDVNMPGRDGLSIAAEIKEKFPAVKVVLLTMYMPSDLQLKNEDRLVDGYVLKNSGTDTLLYALEEVSEGRRFFDPAIRQTNQHGKDTFTGKLKLSSREKEIFQLLIEGCSNKEIAAKLFLSELTIKTHRKNIMGKLGAHNLAELLRKGG